MFAGCGGGVEEGVYWEGLVVGHFRFASREGVDGR